MILWTQQLNQINDVFHTFRNGKKTHIPLTDKDIERSKLFLKPTKFESYTMSNFKILVIYCMYYDTSSSKIELLKKLNEYKKNELSKSIQLKNDVLSHTYIINKDAAVIESITITPYEAYLKNLIHPFSLANYYNHHSKEISGRIMTRTIQQAQILESFFSFSNVREN